MTPDGPMTLLLIEGFECGTVALGLRVCRCYLTRSVTFSLRMGIHSGGSGPPQDFRRTFRKSNMCFVLGDGVAQIAVGM